MAGQGRVQIFVIMYDDARTPFVYCEVADEEIGLG